MDLQIIIAIFVSVGTILATVGVGIASFAFAVLKDLKQAAAGNLEIIHAVMVKVTEINGSGRRTDSRLSDHITLDDRREARGEARDKDVETSLALIRVRLDEMASFLTKKD